MYRYARRVNLKYRNTLLKILQLGFKKKRAIYFLYADPYKYSGSTIMRGQQLSEIIEKHAPCGYNVSYWPLLDGYKNSLLFLTKGALKWTSVSLLSKLKKNNTLIFDPVDEAIPEYALPFADAIVAASAIAYREYRKTYPHHRVFRIDHHVDPRIDRYYQKESMDALKTAYFGELVNTLIHPEIERRVDFIQVDTSRQSNAWFSRLKDYNMHYAIRQHRDINEHKPFLKGFTAARCNSNIIIQDSQEEALLWLGEDYPFLLKTEPTKENVVKHLDYVNAEYGSQEWKRGLETMATIREQVSNPAIAHQFFTMVGQLT